MHFFVFFFQKRFYNFVLCFFFLKSYSKFFKAYDRAADVTCVEQVFGGQLVQHIKCLECGKISQKLESFLDLSLPIVENNKNCVCYNSFKNNYLFLLRKNISSLSFFFRVQTTLVNKLGEDFMPALSNLKNATTKSKHMIKKEKNVARKKAKVGRKFILIWIF